MFGWEFPPHIGGGLGTASLGLTEGLTGHEVEIAFVMPGRGKYHKTSHVQFIDSTDFQFNNGEAGRIKDLKIEAIDSLLMPYMTEESYRKNLKEVTDKSGGGFGSPLLEFSGYYGPDIFSEVYRYSQVARTIAVQHQPYDIIHAHD